MRHLGSGMQASGSDLPEIGDRRDSDAYEISWPWLGTGDGDGDVILA